MRRRRHHRPKPKAAPSKRFRVNEQIQAPIVKLIDADGEMRDALPIAEALAIAKEAGLDLVEVSPQAVPPVCRIVDYGKLQYKQAKQEQEAKTKQKKVDTKGIRLGLRTDKHDLFFKKEQAEKFLTKGHKVKIEILLRGREKSMPDKAKEALQAFMATLVTPHKVEEDIKRFQNGFNILIAPL